MFEVAIPIKKRPKTTYNENTSWSENGEEMVINNMDKEYDSLSETWSELEAKNTHFIERMRIANDNIKNNHDIIASHCEMMLLLKDYNIFGICDFINNTASWPEVNFDKPNSEIDKIRLKMWYRNHEKELEELMRYWLDKFEQLANHTQADGIKNTIKTSNNSEKNEIITRPNSPKTPREYTKKEHKRLAEARNNIANNKNLVISQCEILLIDRDPIIKEIYEAAINQKSWPAVTFKKPRKKHGRESLIRWCEQHRQTIQTITAKDQE